MNRQQRQQMIDRAVAVLADYEPIQDHVRATLVEAIFDEVLPEDEFEECITDRERWTRKLLAMHHPDLA